MVWVYDVYAMLPVQPPIDHEEIKKVEMIERQSFDEFLSDQQNEREKHDQYVKKMKERQNESFDPRQPFPIPPRPSAIHWVK